EVDRRELRKGRGDGEGSARVGDARYRPDRGRHAGPSASPAQADDHACARKLRPERRPRCRAVREPRLIVVPAKAGTQWRWSHDPGFPLARDDETFKPIADPPAATTDRTTSRSAADRRPVDKAAGRPAPDPHRWASNRTSRDSRRS